MGGTGGRGTGPTIDLTGVQPPWPESIRARWIRAHDRACLTAGAWTTPGSQGEPALRDAVGRMLDVDPEEVTITSGVRAAALALGADRSHAVVERPGFAPIPALFHSVGANVELRTWDEIAADGPEVPTDALVWVTSPGRNPDGASLGHQHERALGRLAEQGRLVVRNESYRWYATPTPPPGVAGGPRVGSFSKLVGGGARLGWIVGARPPVPRRVFGPPTIWQRAWATFLDDPGVEALSDAFVTPTVAARDAFVARAATLGFDLVAGCGPSVFLPLTVDEASVVAALAGAGVAVGAGADFLAPAPGVRLCFTAVAPELAEQAADRVVAELAANGLGADR